jgi:callose synthase
VSTAEEAQANYLLEIRLWASYRGQTLARTAQGIVYEVAIKILHWLKIGSSPGKTAEQKQAHLEDMVRLMFSYICACQASREEQAPGRQHRLPPQDVPGPARHLRGLDRQ